MSNDTQPRTRSTFLLTIIAVLVVVVGILTWHMGDLRDQVKQLQQQSAETNAAIAIPIPPATESRESEPAPSAAANVEPQPEPAESQVDTRTAQNHHTPVWPRYPDFNNRWFDNTLPGNDPFSPDWNPYQELQNMQRQMDDLFNNAFGRFNSSPDFGHLFQQDIITPDIDVQETDESYVVKVNMPGTDIENINITLEDQVLTIKGEQNFEKQDTDAAGNTVYRERRSGRYQRSLTLPEPVDEAGMTSEVKSGVLTVVIPKKNT